MANEPHGHDSAEMPREDHSDEDHCPVEEVALVVPETDDPSLPVMTFRAWFLGITSCIFLIFLNTFFTFRTQPLVISAILMQIAVLPIGKFMERVLPERELKVFGYGFSLNPGPFNMKEHVVITIFTNCGVSQGRGDVYSIGAITVMKAYYKQSLSLLCGFLIVLTAQLFGYGLGGILRKYLIDPVEMWWPSNVAQVSLFRALHERNPEETKGMTRMQFFVIAMGASFIYYVLPGYLFTVLTFFSWVCWIFPNNITAQQVGSAYHGLGIGAFTFDWAGISGYRGSPLVTPWSSIVNIGIGFIMFIYIIVPICYYKYSTFDARKFPIFSNQLFRSDGGKYDTNEILTPEYDLNIAAYENYGKLYLSTLFALSIGSGFARFTATLVHVALFHGKAILKQSRSAMSNGKLDVHTKLMQRYEQVSQRWFLILLAVSIGLSLTMSFVWKDDVQLPWWGMLAAFGLASAVALPLGVIQASTNQQPGYDVIAQFIIGYVLPGKPIANLMFKIYGRITTAHALSFLSDLKLAHYMKIPPHCIFATQLVGTVVSATTNVGAAWWMLEGVKNICDVESLHPDSPWTCPKYRVTFDSTIIWGLIGPRRLFGPEGLYRNLVWLFVVGFVLPVPFWVASKIFPTKKWIRLINVPVVLEGFAGMPPGTPTNIASWLTTGAIFNYLVYTFNKRWWQKYNYVLSAALDAGTAFMAVFLFFLLQNQGKELRWWGTELDHCPLASCPTEPSVRVIGCPML